MYLQRIKEEEVYNWKDIPIVAKKITLTGDPFYLTIPPSSAWARLYDEMQTSANFKPSMANTEPHFISFLHGQHIMDYKQVIHPKKDSNRFLRSLGYNSEPNVLRENPDRKADFLLYRPCLIPLTKDGDMDFSFFGYTGEIFKGGYLFLDSPVETYCYGKHFGGAAAGVATPDIPSHVKDLTIVDTPPEGTVLTGESPLEWFYSEGCLICTTNMISSSLFRLYKQSILPRYA